MTIDPNELERLSKAATQGVWEISAYYTGTGPDEKCCGLVEVEDFPIGIIDEEGATAESLSPNLEFVTTLVNAYRTGQLIHAVPSDPWAGQAELLDECQKAASELDRQTLANIRTLTDAQPSGDVVEAVAELQLAAFLAGRGSVTGMKHGTRTAKPAPTMDQFRQMARAALGEKP